MSNFYTVLLKNIKLQPYVTVSCDVGAQVNIQLLLTIYLPRFLPTAYLPLSLCLQSISLQLCTRDISPPLFLSNVSPATFPFHRISRFLPPRYLPQPTPYNVLPIFSLRFTSPSLKEECISPILPACDVYLLPFSSNVLTHLLAIYPPRFLPRMYLHHFYNVFPKHCLEMHLPIIFKLNQTLTNHQMQSMFFSLDAKLCVH